MDAASKDEGNYRCETLQVHENTTVRIKVKRKSQVIAKTQIMPAHVLIVYQKLIPILPTFLTVGFAFLLIVLESSRVIPAYSVYSSFQPFSTLDSNSGGRESLVVRKKTLYCIYCHRITLISFV